MFEYFIAYNVRDLMEKVNNRLHQLNLPSTDWVITSHTTNFNDGKWYAFVVFNSKRLGGV